MRSHRQPLKNAKLLLKKFIVRDKSAMSGKCEMWPSHEWLFVRRPVEHDTGDKVLGSLTPVKWQSAWALKNRRIIY